ncbi:MAG: Ribosomal protein L22 [Candidatus Uhrbacteria bacterium GW2011_GWE2_45_35]|uniref:Ribosomal protein L22 n=2 Tax=Candidatus Uhriibacteriota TaxID=1752732 RepID=A0A0G1JFE0_9BACT|nr:MAG: Ribosomal protein L22 [Candidatus Uhrbacteria bacterium GW2011_GWF2_44_350]KKU06859.1 MAG: Ribosomal protein L22 [Candidatus Uhrbacteria bacterium GW2011_GWE2_45_35]HBR80766.1 hypothetical protein [Candidatus Uhrbacteria bacterium]HCU31780.1 hypothetical protein [Candidatus Uhrbacteria bacterium]
MKIFRNWTFKWWEIGLLKLCLISFGLILGLYFYNYLLGLMWLWWVLFVVTTIYFLIRFFRGK